MEGEKECQMFNCESICQIKYLTNVYLRERERERIRQMKRGVGALWYGACILMYEQYGTIVSSYPLCHEYLKV